MHILLLCKVATYRPAHSTPWQGADTKVAPALLMERMVKTRVDLLRSRMTEGGSFDASERTGSKKLMRN